MCGIACSIDSRPNKHLRYEVLRNLELRGRDGFGLFSYNDTTKQEVFLRSLQVPSKLVGLDEHPALNAPVLLANTRALPTTEFQSGAGLNVVNQQPFSSERYAIVFNGLISNDKELIAKYDLKPTATVDTAMLIPLFEKVGIIAGLRMLEGAYAIVLYDKTESKVYFARNFNPLVYCIDSEIGTMVVSVAEMVPQQVRSKFKDVPPYTCIEYDLLTGCDTKYSLYRKERNKKALVIFSSGIDSVVTAWLYKYLGYELTLLHFTYGQAAQSVERWAAEELAKRLDARLLVQDASGVFKPFQDISRLLNRTEAEGGSQMEDAESTLSYVPNRNGIFAMMAAAVAEKEGCDTVAYGGQQMSSAYPDNTIDFTNSIDRALKYSLNWHTNIKFSAPLIHMIKHEIVKLGLALDVPYDLVCSCYYPKLEDGKIVVCGRCGCCQFRFSSFKMLGVRDTQKYQVLPSSDWFDGLADKFHWNKEDLDHFISSYIQVYL